MGMGFEGLNPVFADRLKQLINASGGLLGPGSGKRSVEEQIALRKSNGCPDVWSSPASSCRIPTAIPGRSNHNHGLAMDLVDSTTGRAVQGGSKADAWLAANAGRFGFHRPVKGEAWHMELVDDAELAKHGGGPGGPGGGQVGPNGEPVSINKNWMEEKRKPEDELSYRLDTIMGMLTQKSPEADTPAEMTDPGLAQDLTVLAGGPPEVKPGSGGGPPPGGGARPADDDVLGNARIILQVGREMGLPDAAIKIGLATALVESNLKNVNYGDRDSLGLFQQRPSQGWGSPDQVRDPYYAARKFYEGLSKVNWQGMDPGAAAQAVQRSAYPGRYAERMGEANSIFGQIAGG